MDTVITRTDGSYVFTNLTYDKDDGTDYLYEVVRPNTSYSPTSEEKYAEILTDTDTAKTPYGYYSNHSFNKTYKGTEIQKIKIGGTDGVDPTMLGDTNGTKYAENEDKSVCAVDVGYRYTLFDRALTLKKEWDTTETHPLCVECMKEGRYVRATDVDHIRPHRGDSTLFWDQSNWQSLCHRHHSIKTRREDHTPEYKY